jgi:hypothetical protein
LKKEKCRGKGADMKKERLKEARRALLPEPSSSDLRGRQSVRATFKLTRECIAALQIVATHLGIKQKSLFDHLMEDTEFLSTVGKELGDQDPAPEETVQKTFVISRRTLYSLDKISNDFNASRNTLIEYSVRRLLPIISQERKKHQIHKELMVKVERHYEQGCELMEAFERSLPSDDPILEKFNSVLAIYGGMVQQMRESIEKGSVIEYFREDAF